jgi:hypothetical protein
MTATIPDYSRAIYKNLRKFRGEATLFRLDPPLKGHEWVVESDLGFETLIFPTDKWGKVKSFLEIANSEIENIGYKVK